MATHKRKNNKGFLTFNKGERTAIICLLSIIVILLGFSIFRPMINLSKNDRLVFQRLDSLLALQETYQQEENTKTTPDDKHKKDKTEHQPSHTSSRKTTPKKETQATNRDEHHSGTISHSNPPKSLSVDLNKADSTELLALPQIGATMASRIQRYRSRLGGFVSLQQLFEIKGMDSARFETIRPYIVLSECNPQKINVNQDEFKALLRHPYLEYEQVKAIVNHRERKGLIKNWEQLKGIVSDLNPLLESYLYY